jgi:hypothetical protein
MRLEVALNIGSAGNAVKKKPFKSFTLSRKNIHNIEFPMSNKFEDSIPFSYYGIR